MPTSTNVTNLKINELKEAQYDTAVQQGVIGANEISILTDAEAGQVIQVATLPTAGADELGNIYQFVGTTDANYTNGYFYKCVSDGQPTPTYSWSNIQVQASSGGLPSQTGNSGKFLTTDGTDASWSDKPLVNTATGSGSLNILGEGGNATTKTEATTVGKNAAAKGIGCTAVGSSAGTGNNKNYSSAFGCSAYAGGVGSLAVGNHTNATADGAIQIGCNTTGGSVTNSDSNTLKVANANGNFEMMSADGTIPTDRFTTTPSADGTYYPTLTISSGTPTRSWGTISALQNLSTNTTSSLLVSNEANVGSAGTYSMGFGLGPLRISGTRSVAIGYSARATADDAISIGGYATARNAIQLGRSTGYNQHENNVANTFCVGNANGNYEMMSADGTIPAARHASLPATDGTYVLKLVITSGVPTLSWVAE